MSSVELEANIKDGFTPTIVRWKEGVTGVDAAVKGLNQTIESQTQNMRSQQAAIDKTNALLREATRAEEDAAKSKRVSRDETQKMGDALADSIIRLRTQRDLLADPVFAKQVQYQQSLRAEIDQMTKSVLGTEVAQKAENEAVQLTVRSRRELMVMMHELSQGRYKNLAGSAMVLEEGEGGAMGAIKAATAALGGPYVVAAGLATVATVGVAAALWKASEAEAEMVHKTNLLGQTLGFSGEAIRGFQYMAVGTTVTTEEIGRAFGIFEKNLGKNAEKFRELGITAKDPMQAFEQVMDRAKGMGDATERAAFLNEAMGRGWEKLTPILMQGGDAAKEAIEKMRIPEDALANFEKANKAQIEIDQSWMSIKLHAGEAFSGIRAGFKDLEADGAKLAENHGIMAALGALTFKGRAIANAERARNPTEGLRSSAAPIMSEEQLAALKEADKQLKKGSLEAAIQGVKDEWKARIDLFKAGTPEYLKEVSAEAQAEADVRAKWDKKGARGGISDGKSGLYAHQVGKNRNSIELNDPEEFRVKPSQLHEDELKISLDHTKKWEKDAADAKANAARITLDWDRALSKGAKEAAAEEVKAAKDKIDAYMKVGQAGVDTFDTLAGVMSKAEGANSAGYKAMFDVAKAFGIAKAGVSMGVAISNASEAVWPANIALMAEAAAQGAIIIANIQSIGMGHAKGGTQMGGWEPRHESGPEMAHAVVPTQIYQASHTTNNSGGNTVHVHVYGSDPKTITRTIRNAVNNGNAVSH